MLSIDGRGVKQKHVRHLARVILLLSTRVALVRNFQVFFPLDADKPINQYVIGIILYRFASLLRDTSSAVSCDNEASTSSASLRACRSETRNLSYDPGTLL